MGNQKKLSNGRVTAVLDSAVRCESAVNTRGPPPSGGCLPPSPPSALWVIKDPEPSSRVIEQRLPACPTRGGVGVNRCHGYSCSFSHPALLPPAVHQEDGAHTFLNAHSILPTWKPIWLWGITLFVSGWGFLIFCSEFLHLSFLENFVCNFPFL